ncbi:MAG: hypothetical protein QXQ01_02030 [Saccharolobus sp.]
MPYIHDAKICGPMDVKEITVGDIILTYPATLNVNGTIITFPPLSLVGENCSNTIRNISWVEGIRVSDKIIENVKFFEGEKTVEGELRILEPSLLTAFTLKHLLGKISARIKKVEGIPLISVSDYPVISIGNNKKLNVGISLFDNRQMLIELFVYSIFYYILPSSELSDGTS